MPLPGGPSDKIGNRFEDRWTVRCALDVLDDKARAIRLEPPSPDDDGVEFWVRYADRVDYHQCKRQRTREGHWTVAALTSAKVLSTFLEKLSDPSAHCVFVSTHAADPLDELAQRARAAMSLTEFTSTFLAAPEWRTKFDRIRKSWGDLDENHAFEALRRIFVSTIGEDELAAMNSLQAQVVLDGDIDKAVPILTDILRVNAGQYLLASDLWRLLGQVGYEPNPWRRTQGLAVKILAANQRFSASRENTLIGGNLIDRAEGKKLRELIESEQVVIVDGEAGTGKSDILLQFVRGLEADDVPHLAFRLDRVTPTLLPDSVGTEMNLPASPVVSLAAHAQGRLGVLIIDQLDVVSATSGRSPMFLDCVTEIIKSAASMSNLRVVLSCRTFDLLNDARLRRLIANDKPRSIVTVGKLSLDQVNAALETFGFEPTSFSESQKEILAIPLHLALLGEIATSAASQASALEFVSVGDLFEKFWEYKRIEVSERLGRPPAWTQVLDAVCDFMSDNQLLQAPADVADEWGSDLSAIISSRVLTRDGPSVAFFHETFFDYVFARRFAGRQRTIEHLLATDQDLFRRAQVRQILAYNRDRGPHYVNDLAYILTNESVRFHIRDVVVAWMAQITPTHAEWNLLITHLENQESPLHERASRTVASSRWFTMAYESGYLRECLDSGEDVRINFALSALVSGSGQFLDRALELLTPHIGESTAWTTRLAWFLQRVDLSAQRAAFDLLLELLDSGALNQIDLQGRDFWYPAYNLPSTRPAWASELLGHYLQDRIAAAQAAGVRNPFRRDARLIPERLALREFICDSARADPQAFVREVWPRLRHIVEICLGEERNGQLRSDDIWPVRHIGVEKGLQDDLLAGAEYAFQALAREDPSAFDTLVQELSATRSESIAHLVIEGYAANAQRYADEAIDALVTHREWLRIGWSSSHEWGTRRLLEAVTPHASDGAIARLEALLLSYFTPWERSVDGRFAYGYTQFTLLGGIAKSRRSDAAEKRLGEWRRKFNCDDTPPPQGIQSGVVRSPVDPGATTKMSDSNWRNAIARHTGDDVQLESNHLIGGAHQLSFQLEARAVEDPVRFAKLATTLPDNTDPRYFDAILRGVADSEIDIPLEQVEALLVRCHALPDRPCGRWIGRPLRRHSGTPLSNFLAEILAWYAINDPDPDIDATLPIVDDDRIDEQLLAFGINSVRGAVAADIVQLIWLNGANANPLEAAVASLLSDRMVVVRAVAAQIVVAISSHDSDKALDAFEMLTADCSDELLATRFVHQFLRFRIGADPSRVLPTVERMIQSPVGEVQMHGSAFASLAALSDLNAADLANVCLRGTEKQRLGAARVYAANLTTSRFPNVCAESLLRLFNDESKIVRDAAAEVFRGLSGTELGDFANVAEGFINSAAAPDNWDVLLESLVEASSPATSLALAVCERALTASSKEDLQRPITVRADLVSKLLLRVYSDGSSRVRSKALDLIDQSLQLNVYGVQHALAEHDRA